MSTNGHKWNPKGYEEHAHYVYKLGEPLIALLSPTESENILDLGCGNGELTLRLMEFECNVTGIDSSPEMVHAAKENGVNAVVMKAQELSFNNEFDGIISNAAIHWMSDIEKVLEGCFRSLKAGGRFVGEFGGEGNVGRIVSATEKYFESHPELGEFTVPWYFPSVEEFEEELEYAGFFTEYLELIDRPTPLPTGIKGWLITFFHGLMSGFTDEQKDSFINEVTETLRPELYNKDTGWHADYVRLRFKTLK